MNRTRNVKQALTLMAMALMLSAGLEAQSKSRAERREEANSRSVMGIVVGPDDQPANGAVVQLKDMRSLQIRSFITQQDGQYHFSALRADIDYQLTAKSGEMTGPLRTLSIFDNRKEAVVNFKLDKK